MLTGLKMLMRGGAWVLLKPKRERMFSKGGYSQSNLKLATIVRRLLLFNTSETILILKLPYLLVGNKNRHKRPDSELLMT